MRVFAGPNGSGKTTIFRALLSEKNIHLGAYVNADDIEEALRQSKMLPLEPYQLNLSGNSVAEYFRASTFSPVKRKEADLWKKLHVENNILRVDTSIDSYLAADLAEFLRQQLLKNGRSFTYETVMSHPGKVEFMQNAMDNGYRVYLYYIATEDPEININRVQIRIAQQGHRVPPEVVRSRYYKSLKLLKWAVAHTSRAYIFDNSGVQAILVAEVTDGKEITLNEAHPLPYWVARYLLN